MIEKIDTNKIEKIIFNSLKVFGIILLYLIWSSIPLLFLRINNIQLPQKTELLISSLANLVLLIIFIFIYRKKLIKDFKNYFNKNIKDNLNESLKYWLIGLSIMLISNIIITSIMNGKITDNEATIRGLIKLAPLLMGFEISIYAPIIEELIFRHNIRSITDNKYIYPLLSGLVFGILHIISSIESPLDIIYIIPYGSLGVAFAMLYRKTDNIFSSIVVHSIHNTLTLLLLLRYLL